MMTGCKFSMPDCDISVCDRFLDIGSAVGDGPGEEWALCRLSLTGDWMPVGCIGAIGGCWRSVAMLPGKKLGWREF